MPDFNSLMDPAALGQSVSNAFMLGSQRRKEAEAEKRLYDYMKTPDSQNALAVGQVNPVMGIQLQQQVQAKAQAQQAAQLRTQAAQGDPQALAQLAGIDFGAWSKMDDQQHKAIADRTKYIGQAALRISQLPEAQRPAAWDQAVTEGSQYFPDLAQYRGQYSPQALQSAVDHAGLVMDLIQTTRPSYMAVPAGGNLVNTRDPAAVQQFGAEQQANMPKVADQQSYDAIPAGQQYVDPQGNVRTKPGGASGNAGGNFPKLNSYYGGQ